MLAAYFNEDMLPKLAVGLVLLTMGVLVLLAVLSFLGDGPLDDKPAAVIQAAADAAADA